MRTAAYPVENRVVLRRVGWELAVGPAGRDVACRNSEEKPSLNSNTHLLLYRQPALRIGNLKALTTDLP